HQISRKNKIVRFNQNPYVRIAATLLLICTAAFVIFRMIGADSAPDNVQTAAVTQESPVLAVGTEKLYQLDEDRQNSSSYRMIDDQKVFLLSALEAEIADEAPRKITNPTKKVFTFLLDDGSQV